MVRSGGRMEFFEQFKVDYAIIGRSALDGDGDLLDFDLAEVRVSKAIIRQARRVFLVCDHSKLGRSASTRLASLSEVSEVFTISLSPKTWRKGAALGAPGSTAPSFCGFAIKALHINPSMALKIPAAHFPRLR